MSTNPATHQIKHNGQILNEYLDGLTLPESTLRTDLASGDAGKGSELVSHSGQSLKSYLDGLPAPDNELRTDLASGDAGKGSALVGYLAAGIGAVAITTREKLREFVSVTDFGADTTGTTSSTSAFSLAAQNAPARNAQSLQAPLIPLCDWATVQIPSGTYLLSSLVDTGNREIVWDAAADAVIINPQNLNGRLWREGSKSTDFHSGIMDSAVTLSVTANRNADELAAISGFTNPNQLSKGNGRDSVAQYIGNRLPTALYSSASVSGYTTLTVTLSTPLNADQIKMLRRGMIIQTRHATKYAGMLDTWAVDGSSVTVKDGWFLVDGQTTGTPVTPTGTDGIDINTFRKAWGLNANVFMDSNSYGNAINTVEFGLSNTKGEPVSRGGAVEANGNYSVNISPVYYGDAAHITGGRWSYGFLARNGLTHAFYYDGSVGGLPDEVFQSLLYAKNKNGVPFFQIKPDGSVELGLRGSSTATPAAFDFHSGASDADYDCRIVSSGGNGSVGQGTLQLASAILMLDATTNIDVNTVLRPKVDTTIALGQAARRWSAVYAVNGTIQTSDEREKQQIRELHESELRVAKTLKTLIRAFKYNDAVKQKGDGARIHVGVIAQDVVTAFASEGLDAADYGVLCFDVWGDEPGVQAGNRFGVRYDELMAFIIAAL